ncbi:MAG: DUF1385 domain-containing protein [Oscillospiraceae bacterium]|nr:DUF1385 domain-containing protein [Oscillospiraceae bacterium]
MGIGGSARNDGVNFVSDNYTAKFVMKKDGGYSITTGTRIHVKESVKDVFRKIPFVKGLYSLFFGVNRILAISVAVNLFMDITRGRLEDSSARVQTAVLAAATVFLIALFVYIIKKILYKIKETWRYHGAEHKTILAYENDMELSLENVRSRPRTAKRCGTNMIVFVVLFLTAFSFFIDYVSVRFILAWVFAYELFDLEKGDKLPVINIFFKLGYWCQQRLFTLEPTDIQLIASIETINKLIELENNRKSEIS